MTDFKPGETVVGETGTEYEVMFGPYESFGAAHYLVKSPTGSGLAIIASSLSRKSADPRRDVVLSVICDAPYSMTDAELSEAILAALDAHAKQQSDAPGTRYSDRDGDVWEVQPNGSPQFVRFAGSASDIEGGGDYCADVSELNEVYGPLTRL